MQRKDSLRLSRRHLTELQGLLDNGLFVVPPAAAETNRCREGVIAQAIRTRMEIPRPFVRCFPRHEL